PSYAAASRGGMGCADARIRDDRGMTRHWSPLALVYLGLAIAGLVGTWWFNALAIIQLRDFIGDLTSSGPAVSSITVDLLVVAVAGPPGAGKSTLLGALAPELTRRDATVAILAFDPISPRSGGAILGDRIRMLESAQHPQVFVRSLAARDPFGAGTSQLPALLALLNIYGFDFIFLESVGAGQEASPLVQVADIVLLVLVPGLGDSIQTLKAGVLELADLVVVNKADRPGAEEVVRDLSAYYRLIAASPESAPPILRAIASSGEGVTEIAEALLELRDRRATREVSEQRHAEQAARLWEMRVRHRCHLLITELLNTFLAGMHGTGQWRALEAQFYRELAQRLQVLAESTRADSD
ncbi:MAG: hypothetical protein ACK42I_01280, partial [Thermomicrobium sp.]